MPAETLLIASRFRVEKLTRGLPDGTSQTREIIRHPGAAVILPLTDDGRIVLVRNERMAADRTLIELPAGTLTPGEDPLEAAKRELAEETGYRAAQWQPLMQFFVSPGILDEWMHIYVASGLTPGRQHLDEGERLVPFDVAYDEALRMIGQGEVQDAKTIAAILYYDRFVRTTTRR